ncbi:MAG: alpha/beta hydrolase [Candidatus Dormibacteraeota bacterium]|nr:alpha/beta hydrolase [Candidatus Dormibacteraeota bacterium]
MPYASAHDGARIYYRVTGTRSREPLVLIMGMGWDMSGWNLLMPHLDQYRVLRLDNRGTGRSDKPDSPYSIRQMAGDVVRCMNAAGMDSAHVYGASLGSMIAQELALTYPARVRSLILGCPSPGVIGVPASARWLRMLLGRQTITPEQSFMRAARLLYGVSLTDRPEAIEEVMHRRMAVKVGPTGLRRQFEAVLKWSSLRRLRRIAVPTLVIHGDHDRLIPVGNGRIIARLVPGARLHIFEGAGHVYGTDHPEEHLEVVLDFLDEQRRALARAS